MAFRHAHYWACLALTGCAIAPVPDQVTGFSTPQIVRKIRCEAREAVKTKLGVTLRDLGEYWGDRTAHELGLQLLDDTVEVRTVQLAGLDPRLNALMLEYGDTAIAYNFSFDGQEINNVDGTLGVTDAIVGGSRILGLGGGVDRTRENIQNFTISDTFVGLIRDVKPNYCLDKNVNANYHLPDRRAHRPCEADRRFRRPE